MEDGDEVILKNKSARLQFDYRRLMDLFYDKELSVEIYKGAFNFGSIVMSAERLPLKDLRVVKGSDFEILGNDRVDYISDFIDFSNYLKILQKGGFELSFYCDFISNSVIVNALKNQQRDYLLYRIFMGGKDVTEIESVKENILKIQDSVFSDYVNNFFIKIDDNLIIPELFLGLQRHLKSELIKSFKTFFDEEVEITVEETVMGRLIFTEKLFSSDKHHYSDKYAFDQTFTEYFSQQFFSAWKRFAAMSFIPAHRGVPGRVTFPSPFNKSYEYVTTFSENYRKGGSDDDITGAEKMLKEILAVLEFEGEIDVEQFENSVAAVYIKREGKKINLADLGFGYSQLIPLIMEMFNIMCRSDRSRFQFVIIEEPEANLHPDLQSKLADILLIAHRYNPYWKLIVETHSEYLVRKLQVLAADKKLKTGDCAINYFERNPERKEDGAAIQRMGFDASGNLTGEFDKGFYDESANLIAELKRLLGGRCMN